MKVLGKTVKDSIGDLWTMLFLNLIGTVLFGSIAYYCEQWHEGTEFESIPLSCWWAMVTITTLGYGDMAPKTLGGKITGGVCSVSGALLITPFLPIIFEKFNRYQQQEEFKPKSTELDLRDRQRKRAYTVDYTTHAQSHVNELLTRKRQRRFTI